MVSTTSSHPSHSPWNSTWSGVSLRAEGGLLPSLISTRTLTSSIETAKSGNPSPTADVMATFAPAFRNASTTSG